jgi:uncharacterized BrkB/YihY/UPF0761 family membrane protein
MEDREKPMLSYAAPDDEVWTPPDATHVVLGASIYALAFVALVVLYGGSGSGSWQRALLPSAVLALFVATAGTFLFLPSRWSWPRVMLGTLLAAGVAILGSFGFFFS